MKWAGGKLDPESYSTVVIQRNKSSTVPALSSIGPLLKITG